MKFSIMWLSLCLAFNINGQCSFLQTSDTVLLGPLQIDHDQFDKSNFYIDKYEKLEQQLSKELITTQSQLDDVNKNRNRVKKASKVVRAHKKKIDNLNEDLTRIDDFISRWMEYQFMDTTVERRFARSYNPAHCYEIISDGMTYHPDDYSITMPKPETRFHWMEIIDEDAFPPEVKTIEVKSHSTKWVKKRADGNCVSSNPDDCLVWCLVEDPAQYRTYSQPTRINSCPEGFTLFHDIKNHCFRHITHSTSNNSMPNIVFKSKQDKITIKIDAFKKIPCSN